MKDKIVIEDLQVECIIGVFDWERNVKQPVNISFTIPCDISKAATSDKLEDAVDYKAISKTVISFVEASKFQLIETLVENVAQLCLKEFRLPWITVRLDKPGALRGSRTVGIEITREAK